MHRRATEAGCQVVGANTVIAEPITDASLHRSRCRCDSGTPAALAERVLVGERTRFICAIDSCLFALLSVRRRRSGSPIRRSAAGAAHRPAPSSVNMALGRTHSSRRPVYKVR